MKEELYQYEDGSLVYARTTDDVTIKVGKSSLGEATKLRKLSTVEVELIKQRGLNKLKLDKNSLRENDIIKEIGKNENDSQGRIS